MAQKSNNNNTVTPQRSLAPLVSTGWLEDNCRSDELVVVDISIEETYKAGHIPCSINIPFARWAVERNGLSLELPEKEELFAILGECGLNRGSSVVVVNNVDTLYSRADAARTAMTMIYAGITNVAVLDGGYEKWLRENRSLSDKVSEQTGTGYHGEVNEEMFVSWDYVLRKIGKSIIADARTADVYSGRVQEPMAERAGHVPSAKNLSASLLFTEEGVYKKTDDLRTIAAGVVGDNSSQEIILYCGVGGFASAWWFVLTQVLDYDNVKIYDGSAQEWTRKAELPVARFI